ncbi:Single-stranded DNA-binding protein [Poriferisphaera corsica]|uniref:Single-stranded DNA-binding protein n=1 Tax=Poriferisphaera corsica TaxID=2528020 RepID=A0A517YTX9_9BACT|nr:single-stranded DNA-binding protein [Poriferisphaera corsica]QDU33690.1 Single-stranded DNA-binding protein [Poriferisphaera corsica]
MPNLNKVFLMGNLTRDPELRYLPNSNMPVVNFGLAINRTWYNKNTNEKQEETTFIDVEGFGKQAEIVNQYISKGRPIFVEGRLKLDQWQDQNGNNRSKIKIIMEKFEFLGSRDNNGGGGNRGGGGGGGGYNRGGNDGGGYGQQGQQYENPSQGYSGGSNGGGGGGGGGAAPAVDVNDDDIPF